MATDVRWNLNSASDDESIKNYESELEECENLWSKFSCDSLGHAIAFYRRMILKAKKVSL